MRNKRFAVTTTHSPPVNGSAKNVAGQTTLGTASTDKAMVDPSWAPTTI